MPQPLSSYKPRFGRMMAGAGMRIFATNPMLGALAMEAIASWSNVDYFLLQAYLEMMGGRNEAFASAYLSLDTQNAKTKLVSAAAEARCSAEELKIFRIILEIAKSAQKQRDRLAHWIWGISLAIPDCFLLMDTRHDPLTVKEEQIFVYREIDFTDLIALNDQICRCGSDFLFILKKHPANADGRIYARLCAQPEIQRRLNRPVSPTQSAQPKSE
jgi:hypothetical protein